MDHVHRAAGAAQPDTFELPAIVDAPHARVCPGSRIVHDGVASSIEAADHHEVSVGSARKQKAVKLARATGDRRHQWDPRTYELLGFGERAKLRHKGVQAV